MTDINEIEATLRIETFFNSIYDSWFILRLPIHCNSLGSTRQMTDSNGAVVEKYQYDAFGNSTIFSPSNEPRDTSSLGNAHGFTGEQQFSEADDLVFLRARYYDTKVGRFISRDPILAPMRTEDNFTWALPSLVSQPMILNPYIYCLNNPANFVDPEGKIIGWIYDCIQCFRYLSKAMDDAKKCRAENPCDTQARWKCMQDKPNFKKAMNYCTKCGVGSWTEPGPTPTPPRK